MPGGLHFSGWKPCAVTLNSELSTFNPTRYHPQVFSRRPTRIEERHLRAADLAFTSRRTTRARRASVSVHCDGRVVVTLPWAAAHDDALRVIVPYLAWVRRRLSAFRRRGQTVLMPRSRDQYLMHREAARSLIGQLMGRHSGIAGRARRIAIKDLRRNWGSCSRAGNLNFNYKLVLLPESLAEYVVVHELCHLRELNHSPRFWALVAAELPDWRHRRKELGKYSP